MSRRVPEGRTSSRSGGSGLKDRASTTIPAGLYTDVLARVRGLVEDARHDAARSVNIAMTELYWWIGRVIVETEQRGAARAKYGGELMQRLAADLSDRYGRGFSRRNLEQMRAFFLGWPRVRPAPAPFGAFPENEKAQTASAFSSGRSFPLPWSHYVRLLSVPTPEARGFYETEALRGGWTFRQLGRQIGSQFYERTALSRDKAAMLRKGGRREANDAVSPEEEIKDPYVLEFLGLKDEYSESDLEAALIAHLEHFLLELGGDFTFVGRQRRLRVGAAWYRVDLIFFHRVLRCLVVIDLKLGDLTHADAGQMHLYLNYASEHWTRPGENPPVGLILCAQKDTAVAKYALEGLPNKVLAAEYRTALPSADRIAAELEQAREIIERRARNRKKS